MISEEFQVIYIIHNIFTDDIGWIRVTQSEYKWVQVTLTVSQKAYRDFGGFQMILRAFVRRSENYPRQKPPPPPPSLHFSTQIQTKKSINRATQSKQGEGADIPKALNRWISQIVDSCTIYTLLEFMCVYIPKKQMGEIWRRGGKTRAIQAWTDNIFGVPRQHPCIPDGHRHSSFRAKTYEMVLFQSDV